MEPLGFFKGRHKKEFTSKKGKSGGGLLLNRGGRPLQGKEKGAWKKKRTDPYKKETSDYERKGAYVVSGGRKYVLSLEKFSEKGNKVNFFTTFIIPKRNTRISKEGDGKKEKRPAHVTRGLLT